jgi:hypothetical protein
MATTGAIADAKIDTSDTTGQSCEDVRSVPGHVVSARAGDAFPRVEHRWFGDST